MPNRRRPGFTLIELMVVIAIIGILVGLLMPVIGKLRAKARETQCQNNMRQIFIAMRLYHDEFEKDGDFFPPRITWLIRDYDLPPKIFLCPMDDSKGAQGGKPPSSASQYVETDEPAGIDPSGSIGPGTAPCSYMYEFSGAKCSWPYGSIGAPPDPTYPNNDAYFDADHNGVVSWGEVKWKQLLFGDYNLHADKATYDAMPIKGYPPSLFPVLRCFWHQKKPDSNEEKNVFNQSFEGRPFKSGAYWETNYND
jgi:prepilin-type N-terminal cleavage/methylation domain-containing protein